MGKRCSKLNKEIRSGNMPQMNYEANEPFTINTPPQNFNMPRNYNPMIQNNAVPPNIIMNQRPRPVIPYNHAQNPPQQVKNMNPTPVYRQPHVAVPKHSTEKLVTVKALYTYSKRNDDDLNFSKGDTLQVISNMQDDWWLAKHTETHEKGYIPRNYVVVDDGYPESHDSFYKISRRDADRKLLMVGNPGGTYILRPSSIQNSYALSIRYRDESHDTFVVKHYKIRSLDGNDGYYISAKKTFSTIEKLLDYYKANADGLCCKLSEPCPRKYTPPVHFRDFEINPNILERLQYLGKGSFGQVFLARWNNSIEVAVKTQLQSSRTDVFLEEAKLMHKLQHPRIVQLLGVCTQNSEFCIITEWMKKGALVDYLRSSDGKELTYNDFIDFMAQISDGMSYLEREHYIHRDLRAANILVAEDNSVKVSDFGLAKMLHNESHQEQNIKFPIKWTAPEAARNHQFSIKSDVWSFGVLMYEIVTYGATPYPSLSNKEVIAKLETGYRMPKPQSEDRTCPDDLYRLMEHCWNAEPQKRPTFVYLHEVFEHWASHNENQYTDH